MTTTILGLALTSSTVFSFEPTVHGFPQTNDKDSNINGKLDMTKQQNAYDPGQANKMRIFAHKILISLTFFFSLLSFVQSQAHTCQSFYSSNAANGFTDAFALVDGKGFAKLDERDRFLPFYRERLFSQIPKVRLFMLVDKFANLSEQNKIDFPDFDHSLLQPLYEYAEFLLSQLNDSLPEPERGKMSIQMMRLAISDGRQRQIGDVWHNDNRRYLTSVTNLFGLGTLYDGQGPAASNTGIIQKLPTTTAQVSVGQTILFNGLMRYFLFQTPGAFPLGHKATDDFEPRLTLVVFYAPRAMPSGAAFDKIEGSDYKSVESGELRRWLFDKLFSKNPPAHRGSESLQK